PPVARLATPWIRAPRAPSSRLRRATEWTGRRRATDRFEVPDPGSSAARDVRRHAAPPPVGAPPDVRVAPRAGLTVRPRVRGARVDDADIAHDLETHVFHAQARDRARLADGGDERRAIGERPVRVPIHELRGEVRVEPADIPLPDRTDVVIVEVGQDRAVL